MDKLTADTETPDDAGLGISDEHQRDLDELEKLLEIDDDESDDLSTVMEPSEENGEDMGLDLEEIEKTLESERQKAKEAELQSGFDDDQLEIELDDSSMEDSLEADEDLTLEIESSDDESTPSITPVGDFQIEVEQDEPESEMAELATETEGAGPFALGKTDAHDGKAALQGMETTADPMPTSPPMAPMPVKSRSRLPVVLLVLLVILAVAVFGLDRIGIRIPYVHDALKNVPGANLLLTPDSPDPGNLKLAARVSDSRFIENTKSGRIFIIKGNISNDYKQARTRITITGKLFGAGAQPVQSKTIIGGNVLSDTDLTNLPISEIQTRLNQPTTVTLDQGKTLPFMIVFADLPDNLREYTVEVTGSGPAN
jgi:hypothetical protein